MANERYYKLPLVLDPQPEGGWTIACPILPGLITEADTVDEIAMNVRDALNAIIELHQELNKPLPEGIRPLCTATPVTVDALIRATELGR